jgi:bacteriorhodopsin
MNISLVLSSFYITYVILLTTGLITFIEALRTPIPVVRHIMNVETCISIVACYFYGLFIAEINKSQVSQKESLANNDANDNAVNDKPTKTIPVEKINNMRYTDWLITTPFMLLALSMVLGYENKIQVKIYPYLLTLVFNFAMLAFGYLGEVKLLSRNIASFIGFIFFFLTYGTIWKIFLSGSKITFQSKFIFWIFLGVWTLYGVFYNTNEYTKMFGYNILDLISKALVGIFFWLYLTKSVVFK